MENVILLSLGNIFIFLLVKILSKKIAYFRLFYPIKEIGVIVLLLIAICVVLPIIIFRKMIKQKNNIFWNY